MKAKCQGYRLLKMGISLGNLYNIFDRIEVENETILKIGWNIQYDFSVKFLKLKKVEPSGYSAEAHDPQESSCLLEEVDNWKGKYIAFLEDYNKLTKGS